MESTAPSQIDVSAIALEVDLGEELAQAIADGKKLVTGELSANKRPVVLLLDGYLSTTGIQVDEKYGSHTIGFQFNENTELEAFQKLLKFFDSLPLDATWAVQDMVKNKRLYLKLKQKGNAYTAQSNIKLNPKNATNAPLARFQKVQVEVELHTYFGLDNKKCGFYFDIFNLTFDTTK